MSNDVFFIADGDPTPKKYYIRVVMNVFDKKGVIAHIDSDTIMTRRQVEEWVRENVWHEATIVTYFHSEILTTHKTEVKA